MYWSILAISAFFFINVSRAEVVGSEVDPSSKAPLNIGENCDSVEVNKLVDNMSNERLKKYSLCIAELKNQLDAYCKEHGGEWQVNQVTRKAWMSRIDVKMDSYESYQIEGFCGSTKPNDSTKARSPLRFVRTGYISRDNKNCTFK